MGGISIDAEAKVGVQTAAETELDADWMRVDEIQKKGQVAGTCSDGW